VILDFNNDTTCDVRRPGCCARDCISEKWELRKRPWHLSQACTAGGKRQC